MNIATMITINILHRLFKILSIPKQTPWPEPMSELYRLSERHLSAKLAPTFVNRRCHVVSVTDPYGCILGFLGRTKYTYITYSVALVRKRTIPTKRPPLFGEVSANFCRWRFFFFYKSLNYTL
jgi:hypothetical protein